MTADKEPSYKIVPFLLLFTAASEGRIQKGYELQAQGFFVMPLSLTKLCKKLETILAYWLETTYPKTVV